MITVAQNDLTEGLVFLTTDGRVDLVYDVSLREHSRGSADEAISYDNKIANVLFLPWLNVLSGTILFGFMRYRANLEYRSAVLGYYYGASDTQHIGWQEAGAGNNYIRAIFRKNSHSANYTFRADIGVREVIAARFDPYTGVTFRNGTYYNSFNIINAPLVSYKHTYVTTNLQSVTSIIFAIWSRQLSDRELMLITRDPMILVDNRPIISLHANIAQLFMKRRNLGLRTGSREALV